jgi:hypothetical protein
LTFSKKYDIIFIENERKRGINMSKVWVACIDGNCDVALFSTAEKAYGYLLDILSDNSLTGDSTGREYWEDLAKDLTADYDRDNEDFGCEHCWARVEEVF